MLRPHLFQHSVQFMAVHIRHKVQAPTRGGKGSQRQYRHLWPQVRAADADVDHIGDARVSTHRLRVGQHRIQRGMHFSQFICYIFRSYNPIHSKGWSRISQ